MEELNSALNYSPRSRPRKKMLRLLPPASSQFLLALYNRIWAEDTIPLGLKPLSYQYQKKGKISQYLPATDLFPLQRAYVRY
jgi:hypothetical protein